MTTSRQQETPVICRASGRRPFHIQAYKGTSGLSLMFALMLSALLTGCATVPRAVRPDQAQTIKKVAVVSILGDDFGISKFGFTIFQGSYTAAQAPEWRMDACAEQAARQDIQSLSSYAVADISEARNEVLAATAKDGNSGRRMKEPDCSSLLKSFKAKYGVDALIVISHGKSEFFPLTTRTVAVSGNGIAREIEMVGLGAGRIALHSTVTVDIYDTQSEKILASNHGYRWIHVDEALWNACVQEVQLAKIGGLGSTVTNMIAATVCDALRRLALTRKAAPQTIADKASALAGQPLPGSAFAQVKEGMSMREVFDLLGQPTSAKLYGTVNALTPYYTGDDQARLDVHYRGEGRITFRGAGPAGVKLKVFETVCDHTESGIAIVPLGLSSIGQTFFGGYGELEIK